MIVTMLMLLAAPAHPVHRTSEAMMARANTRIDISDCVAKSTCKPIPSRYRLPLPVAQEASSKDRAVVEDGRRCAVIGQTVCEVRTHAILRSGEEPGETIASSFANE